MRFPNFKHPLMAFVGVLALLLVASLSSSAGEDASTLSGRVVDMAGHPVSDLTLAVQPIDMIENEMWQMPALKRLLKGHISYRLENRLRTLTGHFAD